MAGVARTEEALVGVARVGAARAEVALAATDLADTAPEALAAIGWVGGQGHHTAADRPEDRTMAAVSHGAAAAACRSSV